MKKLLLALLLLGLAPNTYLRAQPVDPTGSKGTFVPAIRSATAVFDGNGDSLVLPLYGRGGVGFQLLTVNLNATVTFTCSADAGLTYNTAGCQIIEPDSQVGIGGGDFNPSGSNYAAVLAIPSGTTHVKALVSGWAAGTGTITVTATPTGSPYFPQDGIMVGLNPLVANSPFHVSGSGWNLGDWGVGSWAVRNDAGATTFTTNQNYSPIAVDAAGRVGIADLGGTITVDGAVTTSGTATVSGTVSVDSVTTSVTPGVAAANLGKAEDAAHASGDVGVLALAVRNDAGATTFGADQDNSPIAVDANGRVGIADLGGTITVDGAVTTSGTATVSGTVSVDNITTNIVPGVAGTSLGKAEDAAAASGDTGVAALAIQQTTPADTAADGDYSALQMKAGRVWASTLAPNLELAQESATAAQVGPLVQGAVTTAAPTYTATKTDPLSLTTAGQLRTEISPVPVSSANNAGACVNVTVASTQILASFATRRGAVITNRCDSSSCSSEVIFVSLSGAATTSSFPLAVGSALNLNGPASYTGAVFAIAPTATQVACVIEY